MKRRVRVRLKNFDPKEFQRKRVEVAINLRRMVARVQTDYGVFTVLPVFTDYLNQVVSGDRALRSAIKKYGRDARGKRR